MRFRLGEIEHVACPYALGSAESDAFYAGVVEGHERASDALKRKGGAAAGEAA